MRTIKFRGKDSHSGEWFYGNLFVEDARGRTHISTPERGCSRIDTDTIGQFTGLYDKNGKEIYEGDIILYGGSIQHEVVFRHGAFGYLLYGGEFISYAGNTNFTFNARASVSLKAYLDSRTDSAMALFVGKSRSRKDPDKNPARLTKSGVEVMVRTLGKSLGIEKVHPHRFRRTAATVALRRGMPIEQVSKILGHASLNTTTIYANSTQDDLAIAHRKYLS